jgi:hypothetical protein
MVLGIGPSVLEVNIRAAVENIAVVLNYAFP